MRDHRRAISSTVEQAPLKRKVTGSNPVWPILISLCLLGAKPTKETLVEVPRGTVLTVELVDPLSSGKNKPGDVFRAKIEEGVWLRGQVVVPPGTTVRGVLPEVVPSGRIKGKAKLTLVLQTVELDGRSYEIKTDTLSYSGEGHGGKHWGSSFLGAMQGALYGVLFGGKEGAVIGAGAGAAASTAASILGGKLNVEFAQGAKLMFETLESFSVPELPADARVEKAPAKDEKPAAKPADAPPVKPSS